MTENQRLCPACQYPVSPKDDSCSNCGTYLGSFQPDVESPPLLVKSAPVPDEKREKESADDNPRIDCPHCGRQVSENALFCSHCGERIRKEDKKSGLWSNKGLIVIGTVCIIFTGAVIGNFIFNRYLGSPLVDDIRSPMSISTATLVSSIVEADSTPDATLLAGVSGASISLTPTISPTSTSTPMPTNTFTPSPTPGPAYIWQNKAIETARNVGLFTSIAMDDTGHFHIAYFEDSRDNVRYSRGSWVTWGWDVVESGEEAGFHISLVLDSNGQPHIAHHLLGANRGITPILKYVYWDGLGWASFMLLDTRVANTDISLALDIKDRPHLIYQDYNSYDVVYYLYTGSQWVSQLVDDGTPENKSLPIVLDEGGKPHITYFAQQGGLNYASLQGNNWIIQVVDDDSAAGQYSDLAIDSAGKPHIAYYNHRTQALYYAYWNSSEWHTEIIDEQGIVGLYPAIAVSKTGEIHISYYDLTNTDLKYAHGRGGQWDIYIVDDDGDVGLWNSLALDKEGYPHISYFDELNDDLKYAEPIRDFPTETP